MKKYNFLDALYGSALPSRAKNIGQYLFNRSNSEDGSCFPALQTIANETGYSTRTVSRAIEDLFAAGFVAKYWRFKKEHQGQSSNIYVLVYPGQKTVPPKTMDGYTIVPAPFKSEVNNEIPVEALSINQVEPKSLIKRLFISIFSFKFKPFAILSTPLRQCNQRIVKANL